jgi:hypothetical protein
MAKKRSKKINPVMVDFYKKNPSEYEDLKAGDEVVYRRLSDGTMSMGIIKYFHLGETVYASVIDLILGSFQTANVSEIDKNPSKKLLRSLTNKLATKRISRQRKTKKS